MTTPAPSPLDALMAKLKAWSDEAQRLDALGQPYWRGEGSAHPPEWILASALRKRVEELQPIATSIAKERQAMEVELSEIRAAVTTSDLSHVEIVLIAQANAQDSEIVEALEQRADTSESARSAAESKLEAETQARQEAERRIGVLERKLITDPLDHCADCEVFGPTGNCNCVRPQLRQAEALLIAEREARQQAERERDSQRHPFVAMREDLRALRAQLTASERSRAQAEENLIRFAELQGQLRAQITTANEEREALRTALETAVNVAVDAHHAWDSDKDSRVGKLLAALAGYLKGYRADIDAFHVTRKAQIALSAAQARETT